jgi:hypothetical protein
VGIEIRFILDLDLNDYPKETSGNMLKQSMLGPVPHDIDLAIKELLREDARYTLTEMRFSKNISEAGICVITQQPVKENEVIDLEIYRLYGSPIRITSDARWCRPFGQSYFMSGWKFMHLRKS